MKAYKLFLSVCLLLVINIFTQAQCLLPSTTADSLFPVTNRYNTKEGFLKDLVYHTGANIFNIASHDGKYYIMGDFKNLTLNHGPALVIDSGTKTVRTPQKWKVNGVVHSALPDGEGGYYIGGDFTRIGDSIRTYIARIDANGKPLAWNPKADKIVRMIQQRNDTLFIAGDFTSFLSQPKQCLAIYSISGDSLVNSTVSGVTSINSFLLDTDTIIYAGNSDEHIRKYSISDSTHVSRFKLQYLEYGPVNHLTFNEDSSKVIYASDYTIKSFNTRTGTRQYAFKTKMFDPDGLQSQEVFKLKRVGKKIYVVGYFEKVQQGYDYFPRHGIFSFDASSGVLLPDDLRTDGYPTFIEVHNDKIFLSGDFTKVNSVNRLNFAAIDTGSLAVEPWEISPSDELTAMAFNKGTAFIGGHFNGINAVIRKGFAAIDSATRAILPWSPVNTEFIGGRKMIARGDTLFVLGITSHPNSCESIHWNGALRLYRLSDGAELSANDLQALKVRDFMIEGDYLYAVYENRFSRFFTKTLAREFYWGTSFWDGHEAVSLMMNKDTIYTLGDNRHFITCGADSDRKGWFIKYNKKTGEPFKSYTYLAAISGYGKIMFEHGLFTNGKVYVQGYFNSMNGKARYNFACIDVVSGLVTDWETPFTQKSNRYFFAYTSELKLYNGHIWFGYHPFTDSAGNRFQGFAAIDTATGILMPELFVQDDYKFGSSGLGDPPSFHDFMFTKDRFIGVGGFDYIDNVPYSSFVNLELKPASSPNSEMATIIGHDSIYANDQFNPYIITPTNKDQFSYNWKYSGSGLALSGNGKDSVLIKADSGAVDGDLTVYAVNYCGEEQVARKSIVILQPPPPLPKPIINGVSDKCFEDVNAFAKLQNPPSGVDILVLLDGAVLHYNKADSSIQYFKNMTTPLGEHTINIKYRYTYASRDSVSENFTFTVIPKLYPTITIEGPTTVPPGLRMIYDAMPRSAGFDVRYQWQDSTDLHDWQDIEGETQHMTGYMPNKTGDKLRCVLTTNAMCVSTTTVASAPLTFIVNTPTSVPSITPMSKSIRMYPNPATTNLVIDSLRLSDKWEFLEITAIVGETPLICYLIRNKQSISVPLGNLAKGMYILVLRRRDGTAVYRKFLRQ